MKYTYVRRLGDVTVLRPKKDLLGDSETDELDQLVTELDAEGVKCLVINMADVSLVGTLGLNAIFRAHAKFSKRGGRVRVCQVTHRVEVPYVIVKLGLLVPMFDTEEQAIAACATEEEAKAGS